MIKHKPEFRDMTEEECIKIYGFSKSDMELLYNDGKKMRKWK